MSNWQNFNKHFCNNSELGFSLDISKIPFKQEFDDKKSKHALESMLALEKGEIANPDEGRMVGHYWLRAPQLAPTKEIQEQITATTNNIKTFCADVLSGKIKSQTGKEISQVLFIGIGGSALGPQLLIDSLCSEKTKIKFSFFDNTDADGFERTFSCLKPNLGQTLVVVVSKSGGTTETKNGMLETKTFFEKNSLNFEKHAIAISCPDSGLEKLAKESSWLKVFHIWDWVGGRTSIFSAVGLLPLGLIGGDIDGFLVGAAKMDAVTREQDNNPALIMAQAWLFEKNKHMVVLPYFDRLLLFSRYLQQLVMESLGKEKNLKGEVVHEGLSVFGNKGSTDQHAYVQQLRDGKNDFFATFVNILNAPSGQLELESGIRSRDHLFGFYLGTRKALAEANRDSISISFEKFNAQTFGALLALFERTVGFYASMIGVNAYHQPGVEAGKKAALGFIELKKELIKIFNENKQELTIETIKTKLNAYNEDDIYYMLRFMSANAEIQELNKLAGPIEAKFKAN
jgi:glucose-6-phosphate isomerase